MMMAPLILRSRGDAAMGLVNPPGQPDRLSILLTLTAIGGRPVQVELTRADAVRIAEGFGVVLNAEPDKVARWWYRLRRGDRPGTVPTGEVCSNA